MILVRHGQSEFNSIFGRTRIDPGIPDPGLTSAGRLQAEQVADTLAGVHPPAVITRIVASPYRRTLQTADIIADTLDLPVSIEALVRERAGYSCDIGSPASDLARQWPQFDFSDLSERWWEAGRPQGSDETEAMLTQRCEVFRSRMATCTDWKNVLIVTHWGFIRALTGCEVRNGQLLSYDSVTESTPSWTTSELC